MLLLPHQSLVGRGAGRMAAGGGVAEGRVGRGRGRLEVVGGVAVAGRVGVARSTAEFVTSCKKDKK